MFAPEPCDDVAEIIRDPGRRRPLSKPLPLIVGLLAVAPLVSLAAPPARSGESALLAVRVAKAQKLVEKVRGVSFRSPVASALLPEKELETVLAKKLVQDLPIPFEAYAAGLAALGLIEPSPGLLDRLTRLYTRQVVGFYDPAEKRFYIVPERSRDVAGPAGDLMEQLLLAHELTHALQDQRLGLDRRMKALRDSTDSLLALQAFLEGEATVLMTEALLESVPEEAREALGEDPLEQVLDGLDDPDGVDGADGVPAYFVRELVFPYAAGTAWVRQKKAAGGWPAVDAAYRRLPTTTREILRPGVALPPRLRLAPTDRPTPRMVPGGGAASWADTLGEWVLGTLLEQAGAGDASREAAASWQDDRIVFSCPDETPGAHGVGFLWRIRTTGPDGAARIAALLEPLYATRPASARPRIAVRGDVVEVARNAVRPPPA
ncbi:MAG: hypothetical protein ACYC4P_11190 [Thermoanaerobaculia bacterium]